jgi:predicted DsbA family dithiol-disulfide isomerase/uncharacterized membrane protein
VAPLSPLVWIRAAAVAALCATGALVADYTGTAPAFCTAGTGCAAIRQAGWGYIPGLWISVPTVGAIAFSLLLAVTLLPSKPAARVLSAAGGLIAGLAGVALIFIQAKVIGAFCSLCLMVDASAILAGVGALFLLRRHEGKEPFEPWAWALLGAVAFGATWYWPKARPLPDVPPEVKKHYQPGKINVVEFADFECPYCRRLHGTLKQLNGEFSGRVHLVRLNMPLTSHMHARPAAIAFVCADQQGKGEAFGDRLFEGKLLSDAGQRKAAAELGLDLAAFDQCLNSDAAEQRVEREAKILRDVGYEGLPTTFVGAEKILGAQPIEVFRAAYERAGRGAGEAGIPWFAYLIVAAGAAGGIMWFGRRARTDTA